MIHSIKHIPKFYIKLFVEIKTDTKQINNQKKAKIKHPQEQRNKNQKKNTVSIKYKLG
jgi:predicted metallo-beta-lactamase superfamily hydrolase